MISKVTTIESTEVDRALRAQMESLKKTNTESSYPNNKTLFRDDDLNITGIKYNNDFARIIRINGQISGVIYNNYVKTILKDPNSNITGVLIKYI